MPWKNNDFLTISQDSALTFDWFKYVYMLYVTFYSYNETIKEAIIFVYSLISAFLLCRIKNISTIITYPITENLILDKSDLFYLISFSFISYLWMYLNIHWQRTFHYNIDHYRKSLILQIVLLISIKGSH